MAANRLIKELSELIGIQNTITLSRRYSGRRFRVPSPDQLHDLHPLVLHIGMASAVAMCTEYNSIAIDFPSEVNAMMEFRNHEIVRRFLGDGTLEGGESIRSLSLDFGLDRAYIQKMIDKAGHRDLRLSRSVRTQVACD